MACAIEELGLLTCFDSVFSSSVGSLTAAYLWGGQARRNRDFFAYMASQEEFIDLSLKAFAAGSVLSLDLLAEQFSPQGAFPLSPEKLTSAPLHPLVTKAGWHRAGSAAHLRDLSIPEEWPRAIKDSMRIPGVCGWPWGELRRAAWDAAPHEAIPYRTPLDAGATHLLILRSGRSQSGGGLPPRVDSAFKAIVSLNRYLMSGVGLLSYRDQEAVLEKAPAWKVQQVKSPLSCPPLTATPEEIRAADKAGEEAFCAWWGN